MADPSFAIEFDQGDRTYIAGQEIGIQVTGRETGDLTLIGVGSDGTIALLYPLQDLGDPVRIAPGVPVDVPVRITSPFGADHVVVIEAGSAAPKLREGLARIAGSRDMAALWDLLRDHGRRFSVFPFFTKEGG